MILKTENEGSDLYTWIYKMDFGLNWSDLYVWIYKMDLSLHWSNRL